MATLDVHFEAPVHRSSFGRRKDDARFIFNKTIAGHYRNGREGYARVGAQFITWKDDDMRLKGYEVDRLQEILGKKFNYETHEYQIPALKSETGLLAAVSNFIDEYNSPDNLMIIYYGGHGYMETDNFKLAAKLENDGYGDPNAFFHYTFNSLRLPHADILFIVDCCYAARAFSTEGLGRRKYELLVAAPPEKLVPSAKKKDSFTSRLCETLEAMLLEEKHAKGFPTSELYRRIYHKTRDDIKPFHFDQSAFDYGKIWLRPHNTHHEPPPPVKKPVTIDITLQMTDLPDPAKMNELARALQYIPHVDEVKLQNLHAPAEEVQEFYYAMKKAMRIKKVIQRLRQRVLEKDRKHLLDRIDQPSKSRPNLHVDIPVGQDNSSDWSNAEAFLRQGTKLPVNLATGKVAPRSPIEEALAASERSRPPKLHSFLNFFSVAWSFNLGGASLLTPRIWDRSISETILDPYETGSSGQLANGKLNHRQHDSLPSVVYEAMVDSERRTHTLDMMMWIATGLAVCIALHASCQW
ncbi:hypothetical protein MMC30_006702 [Trapelia coarctata]|nr:hypothetical protein [Trapelia coarctata]